MKPLFRAKALSGEWVQGNFIHSKRFEGCFNEYRIYDQDTGMEHDVDPETVGQFTGLVDKNRNKIFGGDIVKDSDTLFVVEFGESEFLEYSGWGWILKSNKSTFQISPDDCKVIEVIGNIHDNPELL